MVGRASVVQGAGANGSHREAGERPFANYGRASHLFCDWVDPSPLLFGGTRHPHDHRRSGQKIVEHKVLEKVPGYILLRNVAEQIGDLQNDHGFKPALAELNDALAPCFVVEEHADGRYTIFVPSSPSPAAGSVMIIAAARVHLLDIPVTTMLSCISKWGTGSGKLLEALKTAKTS
jgi:hypothetical protein